MVTDPDQAELETANALLQLGSIIDEALPDNIDDNSDRTIDYELTEHSDVNTPSDLPSPKGVLQYKHYGIRHHSPKVTGNRKYRCFTCNKICDSKKTFK